MSASKLVKPSVEYKDSFLEAMREFQAEGRYAFLDLDDIEKNFENFVKDITTGKRHLHKPYEDWVEPVPETILWLVKGDKDIGTLNIRHRLNWHLEKWGGHMNFLIRPSMRSKGFGRKILQKGMPIASYLGIEKALITVSPENGSAARVLEFCGAQMQDITPETGQFPSRKRYWLDCS
jgi:predicted acetyltransferase